MKKKISIALAAFAFALLLVVGSVAGTIAYLTSTTGVVTNTFTVGDVAITLDETDVDLYGVKDSDTRVQANTYKLVPGHEYVKDPQIHVDANSEDCWLFVKLDNAAADILSTDIDTSNGKWSVIDANNNVYAYNTKATAEDDITVFTKFTVNTTAAVADYDGDTFTVQAYAVQADGFDTAAEAWAAAPCTWGATNP